MPYDFNQSVDRRHTGSLKWDRFKDPDVLPLWVADMDFQSAPEIIRALHERVDHGVFGYTIPHEEVDTEVLSYLSRVHGIEARPEWLVWLPGLVQALNLTCRAFGDAGDEVMTCTPIYPPFLSAPVYSGCKRLAVPLMLEGNRWTFDFEAMEAAVTPRTRVFLLCNPYNPVGRVFTREELDRLLDFCRRHQLILCSDEVHCDLILDDLPHLPALGLAPDVSDWSISLYSASKTYNLPGLACAYAVIPNKDLRKKFQHVMRGLMTEVNLFGYAGCRAAYAHGEPWRRELITYLRGNRDRLYEFMQKNLPQIPMWPMEATYLAWMDMRPLGLDDPAAHFVRHGVGLSDGRDFGFPGYLRLNFGCTRAVLEKALVRMETAVKALPAR